MHSENRLQADELGFEIVDASSSIPALKYRPGLHDWKVGAQAGGKNASDAIIFFTSSEDAAHRQREQGDENYYFKEMAQSYWPPKNAKSLGLEKWSVVWASGL